MARDLRGDEDAPALQDVLDVLDDPDCRSIIRQLEEPMTASELTDACDIPQSTLYRKLNRLSEASLVRELIEIRRHSRHTKRYELAFEEVRLWLTEDRRFAARVQRPSRAPDERLARMWSTIREEV